MVDWIELEADAKSMPGRRGPAKAWNARLMIGLILAVIPLLLLLITPRGAWPAFPLYLPLHTAMEIFAVVVALMIFALGWHSVGPRMSRSMVVFSSGFLAVGLLDLGHMLSFPGMPDFVTPSSVEKGIEFWLMSRLLFALILLAAARGDWTTPAGRGFRLSSLCVSLFVVVLGYWLVLSDTVGLPATYVPGVGLTPLKIAMEYLIIGLCLLTVVVLFRNPARPQPVKAGPIGAAAITMALGGLCFTLYFNAYDVANALGHIYKVIAYAFLYSAIFIEGVRKPYQRLYESQLRLAQSEQKFRSLMEFAPDAILLVNRQNDVVSFNAQAKQMFGISSERGRSVPVASVLPTWDEACAAEVVCRKANGQTFAAELSHGRLPAAEGELTMLILRDLTERKALEKALADQLGHDSVTGLPNRVLFNERLHKALNDARSAGTRVGVHFIDIDHFKKVNDTLDPAAGDSVLQRCVARLARELGTHDLLARYSNDQFLVLQAYVPNEDALHELAGRLQACIRRPIETAGRELYLTATIGVAASGPQSDSPETLLRAAHVALTCAKQEARDSYRIHTLDMDVQLRQRAELEAALHTAVANGELVLRFQPRVCLRTGRVVGLEALVRWQHPVFGMVPPCDFIPIAEETGLIGEIGAWVLREACSQLQTWQDCGLPPLRMAVNISAKQLHDPQFAAQVDATLRETGIRAEQLELEITESTVMQDATAAIQALRVLKRLGVVLAVDDFGTGYSSLNYLKLFPIDVLKIDRSFVQNVTEDANDATIIRAIIALAHNLGLTVVAEGVETCAQGILLKRADCDELQGYYFSRPVPSEAVPPLLQEHDELRSRAWLQELGGRGW